ncbi:MAG: histidine phosphotransferase family protein [Caulobacteraceae bacterium]
MDESAWMNLTERLADRLCHDVASSAQAIASGLDLLAEAGSEAEREEAAAFLTEAVTAQRFKLRYARRAYGPAVQVIDAAEVKALAEALFEGGRAKLQWLVGEATLGPIAARCLLLLLQIAADAVAAGGTARVEAHADGVVVDAEGPRARVRDEVRAGLSGEAFDAGLGGRWVQGAFVAALVGSVGGAVSVDTREGGVCLAVSLPPPY